MKREEFIRELTRAGCTLKRHGKKHDIYMNSKNGRKAPAPRHSEIKDSLCEVIRKQLEIKWGNLILISLLPPHQSLIRWTLAEAP